MLIHFELHRLCVAPLYLPGKMTVIFILQYFLALAYSSLNFSQQMWHIFSFSCDLCCLFVNVLFSFFKVLIVSIVWSFNGLQNVFIQSSSLYTSWVFFMLLNDNIVEIEKRDEISSVTFVVDDFSELFLHSSTFNWKFKICMFSF